jgi:nitroreductase
VNTPRSADSSPKIADKSAIPGSKSVALPAGVRTQSLAVCAPAPELTDLADLAATLMQTRQTILPKRLMEPGPDAAQLAYILGAAASAPDHKQMLPWRFVRVPQDVRALLAEAFAVALQQRDANASPLEMEQAREKAFRSPCLLLLVVDGARGDPEVDLAERLISAGCAVQNVLLMATALGFASALTSGKALKACGLRRLFALQDADHAVCFVSIGTAMGSKRARIRPRTADFVSHLTPQQGVLPGFGMPELDAP